MICRTFHHGYMWKNSIRSHQPTFFVQNSTHIFIGTYQPLHNHIGFSFPDYFHCNLCRSYLIVFLDNPEQRFIIPLFFTYLFYCLRIAYQYSFHQPGFHCHSYRFNRMTVICISHYKTFFMGIPFQHFMYIADFFYFHRFSYYLVVIWNKNTH